MVYYSAAVIAWINQARNLDLSQPRDLMKARELNEIDGKNERGGKPIISIIYNVGKMAALERCKNRNVSAIRERLRGVAPSLAMSRTFRVGIFHSPLHVRKNFHYFVGKVFVVY